ncbi:synaptotagmin-like protein 4 isoform X2 [Clytia hemisphaerica]|uniref:synaptotagmin-like protein 4 isoform X2 n=1 Tax=Clytia hemisphaerica TaxID=252671 RepID=UPI0034D689F5
MSFQGVVLDRRRKSSQTSTISSRSEEEDTMVAPYGRQVDVSKLTDEECSQILNVISKDILLRKSEKERITYVNKKFEDFRRSIRLANQAQKKRIPFDDYCLICGKHLFTFICLLNLGEECISCEHQCCSTCRKVLILEGDNWADRCYICKLCLEKRKCKRKTFEWFHELVDKRFKRFGSAKILRAVYKQRTTIEPRVITLLAHCRELQPTRRMSLTSMQKRYSISYSKDDEKVTYTDTYENKTENADSGTELRSYPPIRRQKYHSESELTEMLSMTQKPKSESVGHRRKSSLNEDDFIRRTSILDEDARLDSGYNDSEKQALLAQPQKSVPKRKLSAHVQPESVKPIIMEDKEQEDLDIVENKEFSKADYFGLLSITLTMCFVVVLFTCIGFVFDASEDGAEQSDSVKDEEVE